MPKKKPARSEDVYPLKLTAAQRECFRVTRVQRKLKKRIAAASEGTRAIEFTRKELTEILDEVDETLRFASSPERKHLVAGRKKIARLVDSLSDERDRPIRSRPAIASEVIFQFKITLRDIAPPVWRRIQVEDGTLEDLHLHIQKSFGWWDDHLHQFLIDGERFGPAFDLGFDLGIADESKVKLSKVLPKSGKPTRWEYEYDFGDGWRHEVLFEGYPPREKRTKYPVCLEGARACPPEDIGGPWGYADYLEVMADSHHERYEELMEWGGSFDPEAFDAKRATREMRK